MKLKAIILGLFLSSHIISYGQNSNALFIDEFNVSINRSTLKDDNTEDRYGFGLGTYHSFLPDKKINLVLGFEYNRTSQFKKYMYEGHYASATDLIYHINCFYIPFGLRLNMGSKTKFFIETGGFADLTINSNRTGTMHTYLPDENNQISYKESEIDEKIGLSNSLGFYIGIGIRIPISRFDLIVKPDYKFGINKLYSYQDEIFNRYFGINIGLRINKQMSKPRIDNG